jgi:predicted DNA-binding antitoxin AbrB/MazE fold protein
MTTTTLIRAVYENGHLRPLEPLNLREGEQVNLRVETEPDMAQIREALADMNIQWADPTNDLHAWVEEEAEAIDLALQGDPPLSQFIIEDRWR